MLWANFFSDLAKVCENFVKFGPNHLVTLTEQNGPSNEAVKKKLRNGWGAQ